MSDQRTMRTWLSTKARKMGIPAHDLRLVCEQYVEQRNRCRERHYCESCGRKIYDGNLEEPELCETGTDEEGMEFCMDCVDRLNADSPEGQ